MHNDSKTTYSHKNLVFFVDRSSFLFINIRSFLNIFIMPVLWFLTDLISCYQQLTQECICALLVIIGSAEFVFRSAAINRGGGRRYFLVPNNLCVLIFFWLTVHCLIVVRSHSACSLAMGAKLTSQKPPQLNSADLKVDNFKYSPIPFGRLLDGKVSKLFVKALER